MEGTNCYDIIILQTQETENYAISKIVVNASYLWFSFNNDRIFE